MCCGCWEKEGSPKIDNARVRDALEAVEAVYEHSCAGGNLHILLDDNNIDDEHFEFLRGAIRENIYGGSEWQLEAESRCLDLMERLTMEERASVLGLHDGCWGQGEES